MAELRKYYSLRKRIDELSQDSTVHITIHVFDKKDDGTVEFYEYGDPHKIETVTLEEWNAMQDVEREAGELITIE